MDEDLRQREKARQEFLSPRDDRCVGARVRGGKREKKKKKCKRRRIPSLSSQRPREEESCGDRGLSQCIGCFALADKFEADKLKPGLDATCDKMPITLAALCLVTLVLCNVHGSLEHEIPRRSFLSRRAIDGTRGRKYFDPEEEGAFDSYGSAGGQYDPYREKTDFTDIRRNVPGEPGTDYPAYRTLPQTGFTCEGRSRGYYADEKTGCQVFHVCHDVLVSSFLCPMGSIFSQKLLTCDWWTKVDCSSSSKYIDVNWNSYQQDDDEMIRNAYAMITLQSGTDVTKDGLVDPDQTGSVTDYQRNPARILDYSPVYTTGNDLRSDLEDYSRSSARDFLPPYQLKDKKTEAGRSYSGRYYNEGKPRSPYEDSPIIRVQNINDPNYGDRGKSKDNFQDDYRRPNEFANQFHPSYAPTVPTVTTTTRRFYSPTVPTTFRPSTVAYNKLDQVIDSSDYYFSQSRTEGFVTPATRVFPSSDKSRQDYRQSPLRKLARDEDYSRQASYEDEYEDDDEHSRRSKERFQVRVAENYDVNKTGISGGSNFFFDGAYRGLGGLGVDEEAADEFETRGSIGLGHALQKTFGGISVQQQDPVKDKAKDGGGEGVNYQDTLARPEPTSHPEDVAERTTDQYQRDSIDKHNSMSSTTPSVIESTITASTRPKEPFNSTNSTGPSGGMDKGFHTFGPTEFLKPTEKPRSKFQIKVPDLSDVSTLLIRHSTLDDGPYAGTGTTELPSYQNTFSDDYTDDSASFEGNLGATSTYGSLHNSGGSTFDNFPTTVARPAVSTRASSVSSYSSNKEAKIHQRDHNESSKDLISLNHDDHPVQSDSRSNAETTNRGPETESNYSTVDSIQSSNLNVSFGGTISELSESTLSTPKIIPTTESLGSPHSSPSETLVEISRQSLELNETSSPPAIASSTLESWKAASNPATQTSLHEPGKKSEVKAADSVEASTANALLGSIRPETLKQIEESIERNNSPYQVTLTVNKEEELVPTSGDLISKLIAQQGKETSSLAGRIHDLEIIKSVEPEIRATTESTEGTSDEKEDFDRRAKNLFSVVDEMKTKRHFNTVSLLQLMSELLKLDKVPRPFSLSGSQGSEFRTGSEVHRDIVATSSVRSIAEDANFNVETENEAAARSRESLAVSESKSPAPRLKEKILDQLARNFGEPIYGKDRQPSLDLPATERSVDLRTGPHLRTIDNHKELDSSGEVARNASRIVQTSSESSTTARSPETTSEKTVVKTEFVPSIGFSFDTDEGREEYVEAILGGLIEPEPAASEKQETVSKMSAGERRSSSKEKEEEDDESSGKK